MTRRASSRQDQELEFVGEREPCWDAKRRVWQAIDLLGREQRRQDNRRLAPALAPSEQDRDIQARDA